MDDTRSLEQHVAAIHDSCRLMAPCERKPAYCHQRYLDGLRETAFTASGNSVVCDPDRDLVVVTRWCADVPMVVDRIARAIHQ